MRNIEDIRRESDSRLAAQMFEAARAEHELSLSVCREAHDEAVKLRSEFLELQKRCEAAKARYHEAKGFTAITKERLDRAIRDLTGDPAPELVRPQPVAVPDPEPADEGVTSIAQRFAAVGSVIRRAGA